MTRLRISQCVILVLLIAFCAFGQPALAQTPHHFQIKVVPRGPQANGVRPNVTLAPNLYPTWATFAGTPVGEGSNTDGSDLWPCFGGGSSANPDCPTIGDPTTNFPTNGLAIGAPSYTWSLSDCNATSTSAPPCGQTESWYEDDSNDSADDLLYIIEVTQGSSVIADSGTVDFGPNSFGGLSPAANVIIYGDQNFGTMGQTGKNNGNCDADFNYPSPVLPGVFVIQANKTCVAPVAGAATLTATTEIATPTFTTKKGVTTVKYTVKYKLSQKWTIWLQ
jgi:hypothetical protein